MGMVIKSRRHLGGTATVLAATLLCAMLGVADTVAAQTSPKVTASTLLKSGFEIVATNYLAKSIVVTFQRTDRAFLCELGFDGTTVQCIEIK